MILPLRRGSIVADEVRWRCPHEANQAPDCGDAHRLHRCHTLVCAAQPRRRRRRWGWGRQPGTGRRPTGGPCRTARFRPPRGYGYPYYGYPSYGPYYPGGYVAVAPGRPYGAVRLDLQERDAQVFVDGAYAGVVDNFDGRTQSLSLEPGTHQIELRLDGFQSTSFNVSVAPGGTVTYRTPLRPAQ